MAATGDQSAVDLVPPNSERSIPPKSAEETSTFADVAAVSQADITVRRYVEIDSSVYFDCYKIPTTAAIVYAVSQQFPKDRTKKIVPRHQGIWFLETDEFAHYDGKDLIDTVTGVRIAKLAIKTERRYVDESSGKVVYERGPSRENDLLITLYQADTKKYSGVTHDDIYKKIVEIGIGTVKKGISQQLYKESDIPNGNLYFVLTGIDKVRDIDRIPHEFVFLTPEGPLRMWVNFRGKKRKCYFCSEIHDVSHCPVKERVKLMEDERKRKLANNDGHFEVKAYGDSTVRNMCQKALACDVDAMSGGTTCNILNALEVDESNRDVKNVVIIAGQNELNPRLTKREFLWIQKNKTERLTSLAETKKIALLKPPPQGFQDPECQMREFFFHDNLKAMTELSSNILVWENPLPSYSNDDGRHPSQDETVDIVRSLNDNVKTAFGEQLILDSASDDLLTTKNIYREVNSLYKYGCAACVSKSKNKWALLCDECADAASATTCEVFNTALQDYDRSVEKQASIMNPPLSVGVVERPSTSDALTRDRSPRKSDGGDVNSTNLSNLIFNGKENRQSAQ